MTRRHDVIHFNPIRHCDFKALIFYFIERFLFFGQCLIINKVFVIFMCFAQLFFCIVINFILYLTMIIFFVIWTF